MSETKFTWGMRVRINESCAIEALHGLHGTVTMPPTEAHPTVGVRVDGRLDPHFVRPTSLEVLYVEQADPQPLLPHDSAERKRIPLYSTLFGYFGSALIALAKHCYESNEKHNPGESVHWSRGKSDDHADAALRHLVEGDYLGLAWRALALLQLDREGKGAPKAFNAR